MGLKSITFGLGHFEEIQAVQSGILHVSFQFVVFVFELIDLLHDIIEVLLKVGWGSLLQLNCLLCLFLLNVERLGALQGITKAVCKLVVNLND